MRKKEKKPFAKSNEARCRASIHELRYRRELLLTLSEVYDKGSGIRKTGKEDATVGFGVSYGIYMAWEEKGEERERGVE